MRDRGGTVPTPVQASATDGPLASVKYYAVYQARWVTAYAQSDIPTEEWSAQDAKTRAMFERLRVLR